MSLEIAKFIEYSLAASRKKEKLEMVERMRIEAKRQQQEERKREMTRCVEVVASLDPNKQKPRKKLRASAIGW